MADRILVDTSAWIDFFRRKDSAVSRKLRQYLEMDQTCYTGPVAVELYQGAKTSAETGIIDHLVQTIPYVEITRAHYHHAGQISHTAVRQGKIFSVVDLVLAVVAHDEQLKLLTLDGHFKEISRFCPLMLEAI